MDLVTNDFAAPRQRSRSNSFSRMAPAGLAGLALAASTALAQSKLFTFPEPTAPVSCASADVNGDGVPDLVVGSDSSGRGKVTVYSGRWGTVLHEWYGDSPTDRLGYSVSGAGDLDQDRCEDVIAGAYPSSPLEGYARIYSGRTGLAIRTLRGGIPGDAFGASVRNAGDVNGDGRPDQLIGAPQGDGETGYAQIRSGVDGSVLHTFRGMAVGDRFGISCDVIGDVNGDGKVDFVIGAYKGFGLRGYAEVFSGLTGNRLYPTPLLGTAIGDRLGTSVTGLGGDVTGDGRPDFAVGSPGASVSVRGSVVICSGATGQVWTTFHSEVVGDRFGLRVAAAGDVNRDGYPDLAVGATGQYLTLPGVVKVFSGRTWQPIHTFTGSRNFDEFGGGVANAGDVNGDGVPDLVVAAAASPGYTQVFSGAEMSFIADRHQISRSAGGVVEFTLQAGVAHANKLTVLAGSMTGTSPPIDLGGGVFLPLVADAYFIITLTTRLFEGGGYLDGTGTASARLPIPANVWPLGLQVHHAYAVFGLGLRGFDKASNPVPLTIVR